MDSDWSPLQPQSPELVIGRSPVFGRSELFDWYVVGHVGFSLSISVHSIANFRVRGMCTEFEAGVRHDNSNRPICLLFVCFVLFASSAVFSLIVNSSNSSYTDTHSIVPRPIFAGATNSAGSSESWCQILWAILVTNHIRFHSQSVTRL